MSAPFRKKRTPSAQNASHEPVRGTLLLAVPGDNRTTDDLKHGFRVWSDRKQIASAYFSDNARDNLVEFALNYRLIEENSSIQVAAERWLEHQKVQFGNRAVNIHQRGDPVDWFRIGFDSIEDAVEFLWRLRSEWRGLDQRPRWRVDDKATSADTIKPSDTDPTDDTPVDRDLGNQSASDDEWTQAAVRMVATAANTILQSNGDSVLKGVKVKQTEFGSRDEFERYVLGLIETQGGRCAISGLPLQRDGACQDLEMRASLDRIDSDGHYAPGNLQVVCRFINRWKGADDNAVFVRLLRELLHGCPREPL